MPKSLLTVEERFWSKVDKNGPKKAHMKTNCWIWMAGKTSKGYGSFKISGGKVALAHRFSSGLYKKPFTDESCGLHHCDTPSCVRPSHIEKGSRKINSGHMLERAGHYNRKKTKCPSGHTYTVENTRVLKGGRRSCRECARLYSASYRAENRNKVLGYLRAYSAVYYRDHKEEILIKRKHRYEESER